MNEVNLKEVTRHKKYYDCKFKCMKLVPGDTVLVRIKAFGVDRKIADKWEQQPYVVLEQMSNQSVFKVKPTCDDGEDNVRTLHQNMLFPIQSNQEELEQESVPVQNTNVALQKANLLMDAYFNSYWINMSGWHIFEGGTKIVKWLSNGATSVTIFQHAI